MATLDPSILLAGRTLETPNPLTLATQGLSLADLANRNQLLNYQIQQQADIPDAMQSIQGITDPEQAAQVLMRDHPRAAQVLVPMIRDLALKQAQTQEAQGKGAQARAEAFKAGNETLANAANAIVQQNRPPTPMEQSYLANQASHVAQIGGLDPNALNIPPLGSSLDQWEAWTGVVANSGITPKTRADIDLIYKGTLPKEQALTAESQTKTGLMPYEATTGRISANAAASQAATHAADVYTPKVDVDAFGRPLVLQRFGQGGPSISLAPQNAAAGPPTPAAPAYGDQVSRATGVGATPSAAPQGNSIPAPGIQQAQAIANYQSAPANRATPFGAALMDQVLKINPNYDQTKWDAKVKIADSFASGPEGQLLRSQNVAISHMALLDQLGQALRNGNMQLYNQIANQIATQSGSPIPTNFNAASQIVGKEVAKAVVAGGGGESERDAILQTFGNAQSPAQITGAIGTYQSLLGGQMNGLRQQYQAGVDPLGTGQTDFNKFVAPETAAVLSRVQRTAPASAGPMTPAKRDVLVKGALDAIAQGKDPAAVRARLQQLGVTDARI